MCCLMARYFNGVLGAAQMPQLLWDVHWEDLTSNLWLGTLTYKAIEGGWIVNTAGRR